MHTQWKTERRTRRLRTLFNFPLIDWHSSGLYVPRTRCKKCGYDQGERNSLEHSVELQSIARERKHCNHLVLGMARSIHYENTQFAHPVTLRLSALMRAHCCQSEFGHAWHSLCQQIENDHPVLSLFEVLCRPVRVVQAVQQFVEVQTGSGAGPALCASRERPWNMKLVETPNYNGR